MHRPHRGKIGRACSAERITRTYSTEKVYRTCSTEKVFRDEKADGAERIFRTHSTESVFRDKTVDIAERIFRTYSAKKVSRSCSTENVFRANSSDSDDSMNGSRPSLSAECRTIFENLLENSSAFIKLYDEHHPELQQTVYHLFNLTEEFIYKYSTAAQIHKGAEVTAGTGIIVWTLGVLLSTFSCGVVSLAALLLALGILTVLSGAVASAIGYKSKQKVKDRMLKEVQNALETFSTTANTITNLLKTTCKHAEKILQYQNKERELSQLWLKDLRRLAKQVERALEKNENIYPNEFLLLPVSDTLLILEDNKTLRDFNKLRKQFSVREEELESKEGRFICKMKETIKHLQNTLYELRTSKSDVEKVMKCRLKKLIKQESHPVIIKSAEKKQNKSFGKLPKLLEKFRAKQLK